MNLFVYRFYKYTLFFLHPMSWSEVKSEWRSYPPTDCMYSLPCLCLYLLHAFLLHDVHNQKSISYSNYLCLLHQGLRRDHRGRGFHGCMWAGGERRAARNNESRPADGQTVATPRPEVRSRKQSRLISWWLIGERLLKTIKAVVFRRDADDRGV